MKNEAPCLLVDASIYIFQYYFSLPDHWYSKKDGWPTAAVYGYTAFIVRLLEQQFLTPLFLGREAPEKKPIASQRRQRIAACFDESLGSCFRNKIYPGYKCSRALPDDALAFQLKACRRVTELLGISSYSSKTHEADDLLGSLYQPFMRSVQPVAILTRDKDLAQLLRRPQDFLWDYLGKTQSVKAKSVLLDAVSSGSVKSIISEPITPELIGTRYFSADIQEKFGVAPNQLIDYLALVGDSIDDIPGVPGIGSKTAQQLLSHFGSIDAIFKSLDRNSKEIVGLPIRGAKSLACKLVEYDEQIKIAQQLATIVTDLKLISSVNELQWQEPNWSSLKQFCTQMGFPKLFKRIQILQPHYPSEKEPTK